MDYGGAVQPWQRPGKGLWGQGTVAQLLLFCGDRPPIFTIPRFTGDAGPSSLAGDNISKPYISQFCGRAS